MQYKNYKLCQLLVLYLYSLCFHDTFLQRASLSCYAERCISYDRFRLSVRPSVCHTLVLGFIVYCIYSLSLCLCKLTVCVYGPRWLS